MTYVDGFVLAVPKAEFEAYRKQAALGKTVWLEHGATGYMEAQADDVPYGELTSFPRAVQAADDEIVVFSYVTYDSREHRDAVMKKVMDDPRLKDSMENMPAYMKRMIYGGFTAFVES